MATVAIRDARPDDAPALAPLLDALGYPADPATIRERLAGLAANDPTGRVLVAEMGPEVVGFLTFHVTPTLHRATGVGRITGLAVSGSVRGAGVGRELVSAAEQVCQTLGLERIEVTSGPMHEPAYDFYRRLGYQDSGLRFAKVFDGDQP